MTDTLSITIGQLNPIVGDIAGNRDLALRAWGQARESGCHLLALSELFISGYPPEDLVLKSAFVAACRAACEDLAETTADGPGLILGAPWVENDDLYNSVLLLDQGRISAVRHKVELPNYGTFDERRIFQPGPLPGPVNYRGVRIGVPICEDIWIEDVVECLSETGAELLIVPNGSPYWRNKADERIQIAVARVVESGLPLLYTNQVGGQDELVFDGGSFVLNGDRSLALQLPQFREAVVESRWDRDANGVWTCATGQIASLPDLDAANWQAATLGLRDYVEKNRFPGIVLGLSGGIDSAVCAAIAVDALGPSRVHCIMLPYRYTSNESLDDAAKCAQALGVRYDTLPIERAVEGFDHLLKPVFQNSEPDITEENLQSRARGTALMAISNKFGDMVVTTGNKSEVSVGYSTLYGDMNGGFNPIKDLYKTELYRLAKWRNDQFAPGLLGPEGQVISPNIIDKAPTAELRENQTDQDSLPPYDALDDMLECLVEKDMAVSEIVARGHERSVVERVENLLYIAEYKRRQAAPGVKITRRNFGRDRRYPITNRFRDIA